MKVKGKVLVRLKDSVLDVQGKAVEGGLHSIGFNNVGRVRIGKLIEVEMEVETSESAKEQLQKMCKQLLVNEIIENFEIVL